ncbi:uncharacterized protein [Nicotiana tomentosiformis]|uniref:uncharacterized protein n=1 Tax=Nicotiana tomentosiformis TaxID=4098 RepID=UPI00388C88CB
MSYADHSVRDIAFMVGERVLLRVFPMKGVMSFGKKGKLSPMYIEPFEILERVSEMAYKLALPPSLATVHSVFHGSMLRKYHGDPSHVLDFSSVQLDNDITYEEEPVAILSQHVRKLRYKSYPSVRVQWRGGECDDPIVCILFWITGATPVLASAANLTFADNSSHLRSRPRIG